MTKSREVKQISFEQFSDRINRIESKEIKDHLVSFFIKGMQRYHEDLADSVMDLKKVLESIEEFTKVASTILKRNLAGSFSDQGRAEKIISDVQKYYQALKNEYFPPPPIIVKTEPDRREQALRMQQELLVKNDLFEQTLKKIAVKGNDYFKGRVCIYAADDLTVYLSWVPTFLKNLQKHLKTAYQGWVNDPVVVKEYTSYASLNDIDKYNFILLFGTESLVNTRERSNTATMLSKVNKRYEEEQKQKKEQERKDDNGYPPVIPILISGDLQSSIPVQFHHRSVLDFTQDSYLNNFQKLLNIIYKTTDGAFKEEWKNFYSMEQKSNFSLAKLSVLADRGDELPDAPGGPTSASAFRSG